MAPCSKISIWKRGGTPNRGGVLDGLNYHIICWGLKEEWENDFEKKLISPPFQITTIPSSPQDTNWFPISSFSSSSSSMVVWRDRGGLRGHPPISTNQPINHIFHKLFKPKRKELEEEGWKLQERASPSYDQTLTDPSFPMEKNPMSTRPSCLTPPPISKISFTTLPSLQSLILKWATWFPSCLPVDPVTISPLGRPTKEFTMI